MLAPTSFVSVVKLLLLLTLTSIITSCTYAKSSLSSSLTPPTTPRMPISATRSFIRSSSVDPLTIPLAGGLLHASGYFFNATVGGQRFTLQVDLTYSSLIVPYKTCDGCRIGDRRYDPMKSPPRSSTPGDTNSSKLSGGERITCADSRCHSPLDDDCHSMRCFKCTTRGRCCVESSPSLLSPGSQNTNDPEGCAFNVLYGDASSGNGTLYLDRLSLPGMSADGKNKKLEADVLFGAMHEESHNFELPYADGVFGLAFQKGACRPSCFPPLMDAITNATGLADLFTLCVGRYGGTLVLGKADTSLAQVGSQFAYVDLIPPLSSSSTTNTPLTTTSGGSGDDSNSRLTGAATTTGSRKRLGVGARFFFQFSKKDEEASRIERFMVPTLPTWKVNDREVSLPGIKNAVFTVGLSDIAMTKTSFMAILEHLMTYHCDVPGLCSISSWFRPQHCAEFTDAVMSSMPNISIPFTTRVSITLTPLDYLIPYRNNLRCVAFVVSDSLAAKGIGVLLGSTVMARYTVAFDRGNKRLGVALSAGSPKCGPSEGSDIGLPSVPGTTGDVLTADAPAATIAPFSPGGASGAGSTFFSNEESCRAVSTCDGCASNGNCSYSYDNGKCVPLADAGAQPYPFCRGPFCACFAVEKAGWYFGIILGIVCCLAIVFAGLLLWRKRQQRNFYRAVNAYEEQDLETF